MATFQNVHVRINDAATGKPTPCRVRFTDAAEQYHAPFGRLTSFASGPNQEVGGNVVVGTRAYAYIDGACEIALPPGLIHVEVHKGPEFEPLQTNIELKVGKLSLRLELRRWSNVREQGWLSGDGRVHYLPPHAALLEAEAEDVGIVNLLIRSTDVLDSFRKPCPALPLIDAFSGQEPLLEKNGYQVAVNSFNTHPALGSLSLLNCHRVVYPLSFGEHCDDWNLSAWCDQGHRKRGLVVWTLTGLEPPDLPLGEALATAILGMVDGFEVHFFEDSPFDMLACWYDLLQAGLRLPLVGSSGKDSNGSLLGNVRTYARLQTAEEGAFKNTYAQWTEAVRVGRTFVSNGPLLHFSANGLDAGSIVTDASVKVDVHARSWVPFETLEVIKNNEVVAQASGQVDAATGICEAAIDCQIEAGSGGWLAARCRGQALVLSRPSNQQIFAHTSPVYLQPEGQPAWFHAEAVRKLHVHLDELDAWVKNRGRFEQAKFREQLLEIVKSARAKLPI